MTVIRKHLSEPWFSLVELGVKTVEGRLYKGDFASIVPGDRIMFYNADVRGIPDREVLVEVVSRTMHTGFREMLQRESIRRTLPIRQVRRLDDGVAVYRAFFSEADEREHGVVALRLSMVR